MSTRRTTLAVQDLGELRACEHCGRPTYDGFSLDKMIAAEAAEDKSIRNPTLPNGFTVANMRMYVSVHGNRVLLCQNCRYNSFGAY